ncbi:hypothetical protein Z043_125561, partial [Scleropages formosus]
AHSGQEGAPCPERRAHLPQPLADPAGPVPENQHASGQRRVCSPAGCGGSGPPLFLPHETPERHPGAKEPPKTLRPSGPSSRVTRSSSSTATLNAPCLGGRGG